MRYEIIKQAEAYKVQKLVYRNGHWADYSSPETWTIEEIVNRLQPTADGLLHILDGFRVQIAI